MRTEIKRITNKSRQST